jgi:hypothetical protein
VPQAPGRDQWLVAVFGDEHTARDGARRACHSGVDPEAVRIGNSLDALASISGEMREEVVHVPAMPVPLPREAVRGLTLGTVIGAVIGIVVALPFAAIEMADLELSTRLLILGAIGLVFGSFLGFFLGGAVGIKRPDEELAAAVGVTVAVPDSDGARRALRDAGAMRIDVTGAEGQAVDTELSDDPGPTAVVDQLAQHAREESRPD